MKPTSHTTDRPGLRGGTPIARFPIIDSQYQSLSLGDYRGRCAPIRTPSFRNIAKDYFKKEARRSFVSEAAFFGLIVITSTWPLMQSIHAMAELVRAFAGI